MANFKQNRRFPKEEVKSACTYMSTFFQDRGGWEATAEQARHWGVHEEWVFTLRLSKFYFDHHLYVLLTSTSWHELYWPLETRRNGVQCFVWYETQTDIETLVLIMCENEDVLPELFLINPLYSFHPSLALQMYPDVLTLYFSGKSHMKIGNHNYFLSWREPWHKFEVIWHWHLTFWNKAYQSG